MSIIIDGMDQLKLTLPHFKLKPKNTGSFLETKLTGVLLHGKWFDCYTSEPQVRADSNLNLVCLHTNLMNRRRGGPLLKTLYLKVDDGSENKING